MVKYILFGLRPSKRRYACPSFDELNFCVRNGNRWILCFIITGMAPLVGLEAEGDFEKGLKMSLLCAKTA